MGFGYGGGCCGGWGGYPQADTAADTAMEADSRLLWFYSFF